MTPSGIEPATFWLVAQYLNQLRHQQCVARKAIQNFAVCVQAVVCFSKTRRGKVKVLVALKHKQHIIQVNRAVQ
jgi:hypothetical protein